MHVVVNPRWLTYPLPTESENVWVLITVPPPVHGVVPVPGVLPASQHS